MTQLTIAYANLPKWAQTEISNAQPHQHIQINRDGDDLLIAGGHARYKGMEVTDQDTYSEYEHILFIEDLPAWAQSYIKKADLRGYSMTNVNGNKLVIDRGVITFNEITVLQPKDVL